MKLCIKLAELLFKRYESLSRKKGREWGYNILCFHDVSINHGLYTIDPMNFEKIITKISKDIVSIDDINEIKTDRKKYIITFDDGYASLYSQVRPIMNKYNACYTVYISTDFIGREGYLNSDEIKLLSKDSNCTIGSHMKSHRMTRMMNRSEIAQEWIESKYFLEKITGKNVKHGALPYGSIKACSLKSIRIGLKNGYETIATTIALGIQRKKKLLPRYVYQTNNDRVWKLIEQRDNQSG